MYGRSGNGHRTNFEMLRLVDNHYHNPKATTVGHGDWTLVVTVDKDDPRRIDACLQEVHDDNTTA